MSKVSLAVLGDSGDQEVTKTIWSLLGGREIQIHSYSRVEDLLPVAPDMSMILVVIKHKNDDVIDSIKHFIGNTRVVCNVVAVTLNINTDDRVNIYATGYDAIIDINLMNHKELKRIFLNKLDKGQVRVEHRRQNDEFQRYKAYLAASPDALLGLDTEGKIIFASEHYKRAYPKNGHLLVPGVYIFDCFDLMAEEQGVAPGEPRYEILREFWRSPVGELDVAIYGDRIWRIKATELEDVGGVLVTTTDITHYSRQRDTLAVKTDALEKALEIEQGSAAIQQQFINMVSHEFRTPLSIIDGNAQILLRRIEAMDLDTIFKRLNTIRSAVSRVVGMMEGVLSSNMLSSGRMTLSYEDFDLRNLIISLCNEYSDLSAKHKITYDLAGLPDSIHLDKKAMVLIVTNLLGNAVKYSLEEPKVSITSFVQDNHLYIVVCDNGVGIPQNELERVLERYYRASTVGSIPGTGIGLNLVNDLAKMHGGDIKISSVLQEGTQVQVKLSLRTEDHIKDLDNSELSNSKTEEL